MNCDPRPFAVSETVVLPVPALCGITRLPVWEPGLTMRFGTLTASLPAGQANDGGAGTTAEVSRDAPIAPAIEINGREC